MTREKATRVVVFAISAPYMLVAFGLFGFLPDHIRTGWGFWALVVFGVSLLPYAVALFRADAWIDRLSAPATE